jgi:predicted transcriptional regulator
MSIEEGTADPLADANFLPPGEWQIFHLIAAKGPLTIRQLVMELTPDPKERNRRYPTVSTLAQRLVEKGYLHLTPPTGATRGRNSAITYSAAIARREAFDRHFKRFLSQYALDFPDDALFLRQVFEEHHQQDLAKSAERLDGRKG